MTEQALRVTAQALEATERAVEVTEQTVQTAQTLREQLDWTEVREVASLTGLAALRFVGWWLCGRGLHAWESWEYEDGTVVEECSSCRLTRAGVPAA